MVTHGPDPLEQWRPRPLDDLGIARENRQNDHARRAHSPPSRLARRPLANHTHPPLGRHLRPRHRRRRPPRPRHPHREDPTVSKPPAALVTRVANVLAAAPSGIVR